MSKHRHTPSMQVARTVDKISLERKRNLPLRTLPFKGSELGAAVRSFCSNKPGSFLSNRCYKNLTPPIIGVECFVYENKNQERQGKELLLALWAKLLECFQANIEKNALNPANTKIVYDLIWALIGRYEFDLIAVPLPQRGSRSEPAPPPSPKSPTGSSLALPDLSTGSSADSDMKCVRRYHAYLAQSIRLVLRALALEHDKRSAAIAAAATAEKHRLLMPPIPRPDPDLSLLATQVFTVGFFRLPILCGALLEATSSLGKLTVRSQRPLPTEEESTRITLRSSSPAPSAFTAASGASGVWVGSGDEDDDDLDTDFMSANKSNAAGAANGKAGGSSSSSGDGGAKKSSFLSLFESNSKSSSRSSSSSSSSGSGKRRGGGDGESSGGSTSERDRIERRMDVAVQNMYWKRSVKFKSALLRDLEEHIKRQTNAYRLSLQNANNGKRSSAAGIAELHLSPGRPTGVIGIKPEPLPTLPADDVPPPPPPLSPPGSPPAAGQAGRSVPVPVPSTTPPSPVASTGLNGSGVGSVPAGSSVPNANPLPAISTSLYVPPYTVPTPVQRTPSMTPVGSVPSSPGSVSGSLAGGSVSGSVSGGSGSGSMSLSGRCPAFLLNNPSLFDWTLFSEPAPVLTPTTPPAATPAPTNPPPNSPPPSVHGSAPEGKVKGGPRGSRMGGGLPLPVVSVTPTELLTGSLVSSTTTALIKLKFGDANANSNEFYEFVHSFLTHVETVAHGGEIIWGLVPGYWLLVQSFLRRILDLSPAEYSHSLMSCFRLLLHNADLLPFFVRAVTGTTPSNDRIAVNRSLDLMDNWFRSLGSLPTDVAEDPAVRERLQYSLCAVMPHTFCFDFYLSGVCILVRSEHYQTLLKALTFLYTHIGHHYHRERIVLVERAVFANFFRLFLHWCPEIRKVFHYILIFKLKRFYAPPKPQALPAAAAPKSPAPPVAGAAAAPATPTSTAAAAAVVVSTPTPGAAASPSPTTRPLAPPIVTGTLAADTKQPSTPSSAGGSGTGAVSKLPVPPSPSGSTNGGSGTGSTPPSSGSHSPRPALSGAKPETPTNSSPSSATPASGAGTGRSDSVAPLPTGSSSLPSALPSESTLTTATGTEEEFDLPLRSLPRSRSLTREMLALPIRGGLTDGSGRNSNVNVKDPAVILKRINELQAANATDATAATATAAAPLSKPPGTTLGTPPASAAAASATATAPTAVGTPAPAAPSATPLPSLPAVSLDNKSAPIATTNGTASSANGADSKSGGSAPPDAAAGPASPTSPRKQLKEHSSGASAAGPAPATAPASGVSADSKSGSTTAASAAAAAVANDEKAPSAPAIGKEPVPAQKPLGIFAKIKSLFSSSKPAAPAPAPAAAAARPSGSGSGSSNSSAEDLSGISGSGTVSSGSGPGVSAAVAAGGEDQSTLDALAKKLEDDFGALHVSRTFTNKAELEADLKFCQRADVFIRQIRQCVRDPVTHKHVPRQLLAYAAPALFEFDSHYELFQRLQLAKAQELERLRLRHGPANAKPKEKDVWRIWCPELCFDIEAAGLAS